MASFFSAETIQKRFLEAAVLLYMIDPVRGQPTAYVLDQNESGQDRERFLKRKFLDSLALICAEKKGGKYVSAVCIEEGQPEGTIIRIARNGGVSTKVLTQVRSIIENLNKISCRESDIKEVDILQQIIQLDKSRIDDYMCEIQAIQNVTIPSRTEMDRQIRERVPNFPDSHFESFFEWLNSVLVVRESHDNPELDQLVRYICLAREANHSYLEPMNAVLSDVDSGKRWITLIKKLGRYGVASIAFWQLAVEAPTLFNLMVVQPIPAPSTNPVPQDNLSLYAVLRRLGGDNEKYADQLSHIWKNSELEPYFKQHSPPYLYTHAEMQLLEFYDTQPQQMPTFRFIGVSKKSCYLCDRFLSIHSGSFTTSACHQKLYPAWAPPATRDNKIHTEYKSLMSSMICTLENAVRQDLKHWLGRHQPIPADSSGGVSLTGLTEHTSLITGALMDSQTNVGQAEYQQNTPGAHRPAQADFPRTVDCSARSVWSLSSVEKKADDKVDSTSHALNSLQHPFENMVLLFKSIRDPMKQDIIRVGDIVDRKTQQPSWAELIKTLETVTDGGFGLEFKNHKDFLMMDDQIIVQNNQQFLASLQYFYNAGKINVMTTVLERPS